MAHVLIPVTAPDAAQRAVIALLAEPRDPHLMVELLALVEPRRPGKVRMFVSEAQARAQVESAARRWLAPLEAMLSAAHVSFSSTVLLGPVRASLRQAVARAGIDRVLLPAPEGGFISRREHARVTALAAHPVTVA